MCGDGEPERPAIDLAPVPDHTFSPTCKKKKFSFHWLPTVCAQWHEAKPVQKKKKKKKLYTVVWRADLQGASVFQEPSGPTYCFGVEYCDCLGDYAIKDTSFWLQKYKGWFLIRASNTSVWLQRYKGWCLNKGMLNTSVWLQRHKGWFLRAFKGIIRR